jgi:hypothetical protein
MSYLIITGSFAGVAVAFYFKRRMLARYEEAGRLINEGL